MSPPDRSTGEYRQATPAVDPAGADATSCAGESLLVNEATALGRALAGRGLMIATAESCTGGAIARALTETAGSSQWFECAFVTYSNAAKQKMLGVPADLLQVHGAVSEPVVRAMAHGALAGSGADISMAVTGVAGPGGGSPGKPVGTIWFGFARRRPDGRIDLTAEVHRLDGDRRAVRLGTALHAIRRVSQLWLSVGSA